MDWGDDVHVEIASEFAELTWRSDALTDALEQRRYRELARQRDWYAFKRLEAAWMKRKRDCQRDRKRAMYASDPRWAERQRERARRLYARQRQDPAWMQRRAARERERCARTRLDPAWQARRTEQNRRRRQALRLDPAQLKRMREQQRMYWRRWHAKRKRGAQ